MSGCAKVTTDFSNCTKPAKPIIHDTALYNNSGNVVLANVTSAGDVLFWGPRDGSSQVLNGSQVVINTSTSGVSAYNIYMAWSFHNGCFSDTTYFQISERFYGNSGSPSCSSATNYFYFSNSTQMNLYSGTFYSYGGGTPNNISTQDYSGMYTIYVKFPSSLIPFGGYYYKLDSTSNFNNGEAYVAIYNQQGNLAYNSISGNVYIVQPNSYYNEVVLCNVRFRTPTGYIYGTGSLEYQ